MSHRRIVTLVDSLVSTVSTPTAHSPAHGNRGRGRARELARSLRDDRLAEALNAEGRVGSRGTPFTWQMVAWIRYCHEIPVPDLKKPGELTVSQVCERFGVKRGVVYRWIRSGLLETRRYESGSAHWILVDSRQERELERRAELVRAQNR